MGARPWAASSKEQLPTLEQHGGWRGMWWRYPNTRSVGSSPDWSRRAVVGVGCGPNVCISSMAGSMRIWAGVFLLVATSKKGQLCD
jgi:hypothetical protein